jgi:hypothetical protein
MKILSDNAVTKTDLNKVDEKQTKQIKRLQHAVAGLFAVNLMLTLALHFWG